MRYDSEKSGERVQLTDSVCDNNHGGTGEIGTNNLSYFIVRISVKAQCDVSVIRFWIVVLHTCCWLRRGRQYFSSSRELWRGRVVAAETLNLQ